MLNPHEQICPQNVRLHVNGKLEDTRSEKQAFESVYIVRRGKLRCRGVGNGNVGCVDWEHGWLSSVIDGYTT